MQIRVCSQAPKAYVFPIFWNKVGPRTMISVPTTASCFSNLVADTLIRNDESSHSGKWLKNIPKFLFFIP